MMEPPLDLNTLLHFTRMRREFDGIDHARTARWLSQFDTPTELVEGIQRAWRRTALPLRDWAGRIRRSGALWNPDTLVFGICVELGGVRRRRLVQQAPLEMDYCRTRLGDLVGEPAESLCELFAAAPGLTHESGIVAALPQFLSEPMETLARGAGDPHRTIAERTRADLYTWTRDQCACELFWHSTNVERHNIILSHDGTPFLYIDEVTDTLSELSISAGELVTLFFGDPSRIFKRALAAVIPSGRRIEFVRAGDAVERSFNSLDVRDKVAVSLRAARRAVEGRDKSSVWDDTEHLLDACEVSLVLGATIDKDALGPATEVTPRFLASNNRYVDPASVLGELYGLIAVCSGESNDLHYPLLILKPFASCEPVYVGIAKDIALLDRLRRGNATGDSQQARIALLELPL